MYMNAIVSFNSYVFHVHVVHKIIVCTCVFAHLYIIYIYICEAGLETLPSAALPG